MVLALGQAHLEVAARVVGDILGAAVEQEGAVHQYIEVAPGALGGHGLIPVGEGEGRGVGVEVETNSGAGGALACQARVLEAERLGLGVGQAVKTDTLGQLLQEECAQGDGFQLLKGQLLHLRNRRACRA